MNNGYIKSLDGVRALAIILVMSFHAGLNYFGWMGVQLFFVLSGFLITGILWNEKSKEERLSFKLKRFWARRSLRIFPLYFGYLIFLGITFLLTRFPVYYPLYAPYLFTYTFNYTRLLAHWQGNPLFTHLWSLSIEEQFYLFFPLVIFLFSPRLIKYFLVALILLSPAVRYTLGEYYQTKTSLYIAVDAVYWNTLSHLDAFFLGGAIQVFELNRKIKKPQNLLTAALCIAFIAGLINFLSSNSGVSFFKDFGYNHEATGNYAHVWRYTCLDFLFAALLLTLTTPSKTGHFLNRIFENNYLVRIGKVSYGMYIFHWCILVYVFNRLFDPQTAFTRIIVFAGYLLAVYLFAELSFRFYESYFIRLKDIFFSKKKIHDPATTARPKAVTHNS